MTKHIAIIRVIIGVLYCLTASEISAKPAEITAKDVTEKMQKIMSEHVTYKKLTPLIARRGLENFIDNIDPLKTYFLEKEIQQWIEPDEKELAEIVANFEANQFPVFTSIFDAAKKVVERRKRFEAKLDSDVLPTNVAAKEFKDHTWSKSEEALYERVKRLRALQLGVASKLGPEAQEVALQRLKKRRIKVEEEFFTTDDQYRQRLIYTYVLKALASSLDAHTNYFTPTEADQFLIAVQQRLLGIGVQLRDDVDGFSIMKIVEGGPAERTKELRAKDKIIAINNESVIGLDLGEVVERIRGQEGTKVTLRVVREVGTGEEKIQELRDVRVPRGEVVLQESRLDSAVHPFGDSAIAYFHLHSFYQDSDTSSAEDIVLAFNQMKKKHKISGVVLDLRYNAGGVLSQAVNVSGLFLKKGIVVSIKDENGMIHHLRDLETKQIFNGPMIVLINRGSASAAEIVSQTLQDYGRALVVGDDHSYGKGSFQTFTLSTSITGGIDPKGEYKVTRGCYYTASGKSPQLVGVQSDLVVPSDLMSLEIGEKYAKFPLENDEIDPSFNDALSDVPLYQREKIRGIYLSDKQKVETRYRVSLDQLKINSELRQKENKAYQRYLNSLANKDPDVDEGEHFEQYTDFQLIESMNIIKDLILLQESSMKNSKQAA